MPQIDDLPQENRGRSGKFRVFAENKDFDKIWSNDDSVPDFCVLPAIPEGKLGTIDFLPYRRKNLALSNWYSIAMVHRDIGKAATITSPTQFDRSEFDPIAEFTTFLRDNMDSFFWVFGYDSPDRDEQKKQSFKRRATNRLLREHPDYFVTMNICAVSRKHSMEDPIIMVLGNSNALLGSNYVGLDKMFAEAGGESSGRKGSKKREKWGFIPMEMDRIKRGEVLVGDYAKDKGKFENPDFTDPDMCDVLSISKRVPTSGGDGWWLVHYAEVGRGDPQLQIPDEALERRLDLESLWHRSTTKECLDLLIKGLAEEEDLAKAMVPALGSKIPNIRKILEEGDYLARKNVSPGKFRDDEDTRPHKEFDDDRAPETSGRSRKAAPADEEETEAPRRGRKPATDEEEPETPRKGRKPADEEEPETPRKGRKPADEEEPETPRRGRKPATDEEETEAPRRGRKPATDEEEPEAPRRGRKPADEDEEPETPRRGRKPADEDEEPETPRRGRKPAASDGEESSEESASTETSAEEKDAAERLRARLGRR